MSLEPDEGVDLIEMVAGGLLDYTDMSMNLVALPAWPEYPHTQRAMREAGYEIEEYAVLSGVPASGKYHPRTATASFNIGKYAMEDGIASNATDVKLTAVTSRWVPNEYNYNGVSLSPVSGTARYDLVSKSNIGPTLLGPSSYAYRRYDEWYDSYALSFEGSESLEAGPNVLSTEVAVLAVVVLHRPLGDAYSLFGTTSPGKFFGVRLSYDDKLFVQHGTEKMVRHEIDRPYTGQPMVIGFALQPSRARGTLFVHDSDPHRYTYHYDTSQEFMPPAGALQIGGSEFDGELGAVMEVLDIGVWNGSVTESAVVYDAMTLAAQYGLTRPRELSEEGLSEV